MFVRLEPFASSRSLNQGNTTKPFARSDPCRSERAADSAEPPTAATCSQLGPEICTYGRHVMIPLCLDVHPVYGAIYKDGEFVQRGAVLGLSVDSKAVVVAPISGW